MMPYSNGASVVYASGGAMSDDDTIGMDDMMAIFEITDKYGIDRETISVPLEKEGDGDVSVGEEGGIEIVAPAAMPAREWQPALEEAMRALGFSPVEEDDPWA